MKTIKFKGSEITETIYQDKGMRKSGEGLKTKRIGVQNMIVRKGKTETVDDPNQSVSVESGGTIIIKRAKNVYCEEGSKYALEGGDNCCETLYADEQSIDITNINKLANFGN